MTEFTPWDAILGGGLIGFASVLLMLMHGRIAGMTGIISGLLPPFSADKSWRIAYVGGAIIAPLILSMFSYDIAFSVPISQSYLIVGGLLVGMGVFLSSGCTSGHGVCGLARFSIRSLAATLTFMAFTFVTVYVVRHVMGV